MAQPIVTIRDRLGVYMRDRYMAEIGYARHWAEAQTGVVKMQQFNIPATFMARVREQDFAINDLHAWPEISIAKVFEYGMQQIFNDAAASAKDKAEALALAQKKLDNLRNGVLRASPVRESDPIKAEAMRISTAQVEDALKAAGHKLKDIGAAQIRELAKANFEKNGATIMPVAEANVTGTKALAVTVDLSGLKPTESE